MYFTHSQFTIPNPQTDITIWQWKTSNWSQVHWIHALVLFEEHILAFFESQILFPYKIVHVDFVIISHTLVHTCRNWKKCSRWLFFFFNLSILIPGLFHFRLILFLMVGIKIIQIKIIKTLPTRNELIIEYKQLFYVYHHVHLSMTIRLIHTFISINLHNANTKRVFQRKDFPIHLRRKIRNIPRMEWFSRQTLTIFR